ncbi:hypothetical protein Tco_0552891 [Tanacetum coccineum]
MLGALIVDCYEGILPAGARSAGFWRCRWVSKNIDSDGPGKNRRSHSTISIGVSKKNNVNTSGTKKEDVDHTIEVCNSNIFDLLNSVENDVDLGTNGGTSNVATQKVNSSGSSFWNVESSSTSTTHIVEKLIKMKELLLMGRLPLWMMRRRLACTHSLLEQWKDSYVNGDYDFDPYDDDMYEGQDIPDKIQDICDNFDIKVRGRRKK